MAIREIALKNQLQRVNWKSKDTYFGPLIVFVIASFVAYLQPFEIGKTGGLHRWVFWLTICFLGYLIYKPFIALGTHLLLGRYPCLSDRRWLTLSLLTLVASIIMTFLSPLVVLAFFESPVGYMAMLSNSAVMSLFIGGLITLIDTLKSLLNDKHQTIHEQQQQLQQEKTKNDSHCYQGVEQLLSKIPPEKRGQLLYLKIEDHYLSIRTDKGNDLVLFRFKDALALVKDYPGIQVNRSWWVAESAIGDLYKQGRKWVLALSNDVNVPVSQKHLKAVKTLVNNKQNLTKSED
ncbi:MAG: LytTR family DNA-binding domain-containing protein [Cellvibrionaceae bacterium]